MKTFFKILLVIGIVIAVLIGLVIGIAFFAVNSQTTNEEITFGDDVIPTIYAVLGERKVVSVSSGFKNDVSYKTMTYDENVISNDDINDYGLHLKEEEDFIVTENNSDLIQLAKESVDEGELILVNIMKEGNSVVIEYRKGEGTLTIY